MDNFCVIYGSDSSLVRYECEKLLKEFKDVDVVKYDMQEVDLSDVIDDASTVGMFSGKKVIILDDCSFLGSSKGNTSLEELEDYLEHYNHDNYCIFLSYQEKLDSRKKINKLLSKHKVIEVKKADTSNLNQFVLDDLKKDGYKMESVPYFLNRVGSSLPNIKNELQKLMMYKMDEKFISNQDVDKISVLTSEEEIFSLTDAIVARDTLKSLNLLEEFLNRSYDEMQIIMLLASQFRFFFQVKRLLNKNKSEGEIAKILEVNPYRVKFTVKKLYSYSEDMITSYIQQIAKMDHDIKLGIMDKNLALQLFITMNCT